MRIRITRHATGTAEGVALDQFFEGYVYEVSIPLGDHLVSQGVAVAVDERWPGLLLPLDHPIARRIGRRGSLE